MENKVEIVRDKFYMVKNAKEGAEYATATMHRTREEAEEEARRLAKKHPGDTFVIMKSVYFFREKTAKEKLFFILKRSTHDYAGLEKILENFEIKEIRKNQ